MKTMGKLMKKISKNERRKFWQDSIDLEYDNKENIGIEKKTKEYLWGYKIKRTLKLMKNWLEDRALYQCTFKKK